MVSRKSTLLWSLGDLGNHQPLGCRTDGAINRCMGSVSATSGPDTELQVPDEILQNCGMKMSFFKDVSKLPNVKTNNTSTTMQSHSRVNSINSGRSPLLYCTPTFINIYSTCPLHTNGGRGKERRIIISPAALVRNYLEVYWPRAGGLSA